MANNKRLVVYLHKNSESGQVFYVGCGLKDRAYNFKSRSKKWLEYVRMYGKPKVEIYKSNLNPIEALYLESYLIRVFGRAKIDENGTLVNKKVNSDCANLYGFEENHSNWGKKHSVGAKIKIGDGNRGKKVSDESKIKMSKTHLVLRQFAKKIKDNKTGIVYDSIGDAANANGIAMKVLSSWLRGIVKSRIGEFEYYK